MLERDLADGGIDIFDFALDHLVLFALLGNGERGRSDDKGHRSKEAKQEPGNEEPIYACWFSSS